MNNLTPLALPPRAPDFIVTGAEETEMERQVDCEQQRGRDRERQADSFHPHGEHPLPRATMRAARLRPIARTTASRAFARAARNFHR